MVHRRKSFLTFFALCATPLLLLAGLNWWNGYRSVDSTIRSIVQEDLNSLNAGVDEVLRDQENAILRLAMMRNIQSEIRAGSATPLPKPRTVRSQSKRALVRHAQHSVGKLGQKQHSLRKHFATRRPHLDRQRKRVTRPPRHTSLKREVARIHGAGS